MTDAMMVVVEFPVELRDAAGHPTGTNRGWLPISDPALPLALSRTQEIARTDDVTEVQRLVEEGRCVVVHSQFNALAGLEIVGLDPKRVFPMAWTHLTGCATCRAAYETRLVEILQLQ